MKVIRNIVLWAIVVAGFVVLGATEGAKEEVYKFYIVATVLAIAFPIIYVIHFFATPAKINAEQNSKIKDLEEAPGRRSAEEEAVITELWQLRNAGVPLRSRSLETKEEVPGWVDEFMTWRQRVYERLDIIDPNLRHWLNVLNNHSQVLIGNIMNEEHGNQQRCFSEEINRLEQILLRKTNV